MFCGNCGQELKDDAKFCHGCGASQVRDAAAETESAGAGVVEGAGGVRKPVRTKRTKTVKKPPVWIPIAIAGVVLVALLGILIGSLLGGDAAKLIKAVDKTAKAYTDAYEKLDMPDLSYIAEKQAYSTTMAMTIDEVDGSSEMEGFGVRMSADVSLDKRSVGMSVTPFFGAADIINANLKIDNEKVYVGSPELTGETFYMINTETLGKDLNNLGVDDEGLEAFGFNLFDIVQQIEKINKENEQVAKDVEKAVTEFVKTIEVEKTDSEKYDVNGNELKCTVYDVVLSEDAMADLVDAIEDAYKKVDNTDAYLEILESMGFPDYAIEEMEYELEYATEDTDEIFDGLREAVDMLRDVELKVYVSDGYVVAVVYDDKIDGSSVEISLELGGGKNYVDDLSLTIDADGAKVRLTSTGDHSCASGTFTDKTTIKVSEGTDSYNPLTMKTSYEPKAKSNNFQWEFETENAGMEVSGQVNTGSDSITMALDEVRISEYGYDMMKISLDYYIGKYQASSIKTRDVVALSSLDEDKLMDEVEKIQENAMEWAEDLMEQYPELMYYFY